MSGPDLGPGCYCPPANVGDGIKPQPECPVHAYLTAEHGSEEGGEGLTEAEQRIASGRIKHGVGASEDFPGNVCHLVSPIVGWMRLLERDGKPFDDLAHAIDRLGLVLDMAHAEADRAESAEAALNDLRGRLAALADEWESASAGNWRDVLARSNPSLTYTDAAEALRAALANPSAAQGEGEVEARVQWSVEAEDGTTCYTSEDTARAVAGGYDRFTLGIDRSPVVAAFTRTTPDDEWRPFANPSAPEADQ